MFQVKDLRCCVHMCASCEGIDMEKDMEVADSMTSVSVCCVT